MIGQTISQYRINEKLGFGGMGVVYKAEDTKLKRTVALKFLPPHLSASEQDRARFVQEAQAASAINHPNICTIHDIQEHDGSIFLVMEYVEGYDLKEKIRRGLVSPDEALSIATRVAEGLQAAHKKAIVHRDIKSTNIMLTDSGQVKIMDFGLAKVRGGLHITKIGTTIGTAAYMSPEQARGDEVDHRTDIWSLGVVLYELLAGQLPFQSDYEQAIIYSVLHEEPPPLKKLVPAIPSSLSDVVRKLLAKEPIQRYQNMEDVTEQLQRVRLELGRSPKAETGPPRSIAVLPFDNISPEKETEYFSDGLTEEIITSLTKIRTLKVISRTSAMHYKGTTKTLRQIADELQVQYVLEGSVRKSGKHVRITAQLIDASEDAHLWAERYAGTLDDLFEIQDRVAAEIVSGLKLQLSSEERQQLKKRGTGNAEAYQDYLKGRYHWNIRTEESLKRSREFFMWAVEKDPTYALAYVGLSDTYSILGFWNALNPREAFAKAQSAAQKALEIDPELGEAHTSLAYTMLYTWQWKMAEREFRRGIELNPAYAIGHQWFGNYLVVQGRFEEAAAEFERARVLDPLSLIISAATAWSYYFGRQFDTAIALYKKTIEMDASFAVAHEWLGRVYVQLGDYEQALPKIERAISLADSPTSIAVLGHCHAQSGNRAEAQRILGQLKKLSQERYVSPYDIAEIYVGLNEKDSAFEWLEKAYQDGARGLAFVKVEPRLDSIRDDPKFMSLLTKVGLRP